MRQSISTRYAGPTNSRGSKCIATSASGHRLIVEWDDALNSDENHVAAATALAQKLGWSGRWHGGGTKEGSCFVCEDNEVFVIARAA